MPETICKLIATSFAETEKFCHICHLRPCGLMEKASVSGAGDCRFESCHGRHLLSHLGKSRNLGLGCDVSVEECVECYKLSPAQASMTVGTNWNRFRCPIVWDHICQT